MAERAGTVQPPAQPAAAAPLRPADRRLTVDGVLADLVADQLIAKEAADKEEAKKEAILRLKGFAVVGSMENPPTNPMAVEMAREAIQP